MVDLWSMLYEGALTNIFGNATFLGLTLLLFIGLMLFLSNASKILIIPLLLIFSYGLLQYGLIPIALFGGLLIITGLIFALTILNAIFQ